MCLDCYESWTRVNVPNSEAAHRKCKEWAYAMVACFPELRLVRGHYVCPVEGKVPHWWCVTPLECIVDPTAIQFVSLGSGEYIPYDESLPEPTGKCLNCGELRYNDDGCCGPACHGAVLKSFAKVVA